MEVTVVGVVPCPEGMVAATGEGTEVVAVEAVGAALPLEGMAAVRVVERGGHWVVAVTVVGVGPSPGDMAVEMAVVAQVAAKVVVDPDRDREDMAVAMVGETAVTVAPGEERVAAA